MSISLWLETLTMEEMFLLTYGIIFGLTLLFIPVAVWIDKKTGRGKVRIRDELKPCPRCQSPRPYIIKIHPTKGIFTKYYVSCRFCYYCEATKMGRRRAIRAWNRGENLWKYI